MPNIVHELIVEIARVQALLEKMEPTEREQTQHILRYARHQMAMNQYEGMREALDDLKEFGKPSAK
jgi:hypothetical protein